MDKVVISRTSAIWRYYEFLNSTRDTRGAWNHENLNLCVFFRRIVFWSIYLIVKLVFVLALVLIPVGCMLIAVYWPIAHGWISPQGHNLAGFVMVGASLWGLVVLVAGIVFGSYLYDAGKRRASNNKDGKQNLLLAWLRAKKQKVCPLIGLKE